MSLNREIKAFASRVKMLQLVVGFADITAAGMSKTLDMSALPVGAFVLGIAFNVTTDFDDGAGATNKVDVGIAGTLTGFVAGSADNLGTIGKVPGGTAGTLGGTLQSGATPRLTFTGSANLSTLTQGSVTISVLYINTDAVTGEERG
jgi:hypothetical protein